MNLAAHRRRRCTGLFAVAFAALACLAVQITPALAGGAGDDQLDLTPLYAEQPFATQERQVAFQDYVDRLKIENGVSIDVPAEFWLAAPTMTFWGYSFSDNGDDTVTIRFRQSFDVTSVLETVLREVGGLRVDGCSFFAAQNPYVLLSSPKNVIFGAEISGKKRACGRWPWGGEWKTDLGDISGHISGSLPFKAQLTPMPQKYRGEFVALPISISVDVDVESIFGINVHSVAGQIIKTVADLLPSRVVIQAKTPIVSFSTTVSLIDANLFRVPRDAHINGDFVLENDGRFSSERYRAFISKVTGMTWSIQPSFDIDPASSGLRQNGANYTVDLVFVARTKPNQPFMAVRPDIEREVEILNSLGQKTNARELSRGDNLWRISKDAYRNPFYFQLLAAYNGWTRLQADKLRLGTTVQIPPLHALFPQRGRYFMQPGRGLIETCRERSSLPITECLAEIKKMNTSLRHGRPFALEYVALP